MKRPAWKQQRGFFTVREALDMAENHHVIAIGERNA